MDTLELTARGKAALLHIDTPELGTYVVCDTVAVDDEGQEVDDIAFVMLNGRYTPRPKVVHGVRIYGTVVDYFEAQDRPEWRGLSGFVAVVRDHLHRTEWAVPVEMMWPEGGVHPLAVN